MSTLEIEFIPDARPSTAMVHLRGRASYKEAAHLREELFAAIAANGDRNLVVALEEVASMDTAAMAVLVEALRDTHDQGPDIYLVGATESVRRVFRLAGLEEALTRCFGCMAEMEEALERSVAV